ncbi:MAG: hypothetical protein ACI82G_002105, partial [Bradymonadia bacterium]
MICTSHFRMIVVPTSCRFRFDVFFVRMCR